MYLRFIFSPPAHSRDRVCHDLREEYRDQHKSCRYPCGPPAGHFAAGKLAFDAVGLGHVHPDANHFIVFGCGEWLLRDDGYAWKDTGQHNTLLVDGKGQVGEGSAGFSSGGMNVSSIGLYPRVIAATSSEAVDRISGDATVMYPAAAGLKRYVRSLYFLKPDVLIVVDDIETEGPRRLGSVSIPNRLARGKRMAHFWLADPRRSSVSSRLRSMASKRQPVKSTAGIETVNPCQCILCGYRRVVRRGKTSSPFHGLRAALSPSA
jgi:hypothetical protein